MKMFKNVVFASILFVGFISANTEKVEILKETVTIVETAVNTAAPKVAENVAQAGFFSNVASGIKHVVWTAPTTFVSNHKLLTAFVVAGVITAAVVTYVVLNEEAEEAA